MSASVAPARQSQIWPFAAICSFYFLAVISLSFLIPPERATYFLKDDSYFYMKIAQNLRDGYGSSFDGLNSTNGYHPLWLVVLTLLSFVAPIQGMAGIREVLLVHGLFSVAAAFLMHQFMRRLGISQGWRLLSVVAVLGSTGVTEVGTESAILLFTSWAFVWCVTDLELTPVRKVAAACLASAVVLARVDAVVLIVAVFGAATASAWLRPSEGRSGAGYALYALLPAALTVLALGIYNFVFFGHWLSVSAELKSQWPGTFSTHWLSYSVNGFTIKFFTPVVVALMVVVRYGPWQTGPLDKAQQILMGMNCYVILHFLAIIFFSSSEPGTWYLTLDFSILVCSVCLLGSRVAANWNAVMAKRSIMMALIGAALVMAVLNVERRFQIPLDNHQDVAMWLSENLGTDQTAFQVDVSGEVAYFSEKPVINGDGLVNSWRYQDDLRTGRLKTFLSRENVAYVISHRPSEDGWVTVDIPTWDGEVITLGRAPIERAVFIAGRFAVFPAVEFGITSPSHQTVGPE